MFKSIGHVVVLNKRRQVGDIEEKLIFVRDLLHCQQVTMAEAYW